MSERERNVRFYDEDKLSSLLASGSNITDKTFTINTAVREGYPLPDAGIILNYTAANNSGLFEDYIVPEETQPFYLYSGVDESTPSANVPFTLSGGNITTPASLETDERGIAWLPIDLTSNEYTISYPVIGEITLTVSPSGSGDVLITEISSVTGVALAETVQSWQGDEVYGGYYLQILTAPPTVLSYTVVQDGGVPGKADSKAIILTFDTAVSNLNQSSISAEDGVTFGTPTVVEGGGDTQWRVPITDLGTVKDSAEIDVTVKVWVSYAISNATQSVTLYKRGTEITFTLARMDGEEGLADTTGILLTFSADVDSLIAEQISMYGAKPHSVTDNDDSDAKLG